MTTYTGTSLSFSQIGTREDLALQMSVLFKQKFPLLDALGMGPNARQTYVEWTALNLKNSNTDGGAIEGKAADPSSARQPVRYGNPTQILEDSASVSTTQEASDVVGDVQSLEAQMMIIVSEKMQQLERTLLSHNVPRKGTATQSRRLGSLATWMSNNKLTGASGAIPGYNTTTGLTQAITDGTIFQVTEDQYNDLGSDIWNEGGDPRVIVTNSFQKRIIGKFAGNNTRYVDMADRDKVEATVDFYRDENGTYQGVYPTRNAWTRGAGSATAVDILFLDPDYLELRSLVAPRTDPLGRRGISREEQFHWELTFVNWSPEAHGIITDQPANRATSDTL